MTKSTNSANVETLYPCTETFWSRINRAKKYRSDKAINLILSIGQIKKDEKCYDVNDEEGYASDYSELIDSGVLSKEGSPCKFSELSESAGRRKRTAEISMEHPAEIFVGDLYNNTDSPLHHGFTYEHSILLTKYFTTQKWVGGKYAWQEFTKRGSDKEDWPTVDELSLASISRLHLPEGDKKMGKGLHPPIDGRIPRKHISAPDKNTTKDVSASIDKFGEYSFKGQVAMANAITASFANKEEVKTTEPYSFEFFRGNDVSMSQLYDAPGTLMEEVMNHMWNNDRSGVFDFDVPTMEALQEKKMVLRMFVSSSKQTTEREFGTETFALLTVSKLARLCKNNSVKINVQAKYIVGETLARRQLFDWK